MKTFEQILKRKQKYYGKTEASYEFAAEEFAKEYHKEQLRLYIVSGMLPNDFKQLPEKLQCKLVRKHTHAELVDGEKIVYKEQDVLDIIKYVSEGNYR